MEYREDRHHVLFSMGDLFFEYDEDSPETTPERAMRFRRVRRSEAVI